MKSQGVKPPQYFIGWDVGAWHCPKARRKEKSADAIVILDEQRQLVGIPWQGNLCETINLANSARDFLGRIFTLANAELPVRPFSAILAIDAPLGFSKPFLELVGSLVSTSPIESFKTNPYLFRHTEQFLFKHGLKPLSAVQDMIGSQATKGMQVLAKFAKERLECGVWSQDAVLTVIETYPAACNDSPYLERLRFVSCSKKCLTQDECDAYTCALVGSLFKQNPNTLATPPKEVPEIEGWIWVPKDRLKKVTTK